jgi:hypothetical protein
MHTAEAASAIGLRLILADSVLGFVVGPSVLRLTFVPVRDFNLVAAAHRLTLVAGVIALAPSSSPSGSLVRNPSQSARIYPSVPEKVKGVALSWSCSL